MAKNFHINVEHHNGKVFLKLHGDFDGISAFELLLFLKERCSNYGEVIIDTDGLKRIFCFGVEVWNEQLQMIDDLINRVSFSGEHACYLNMKDIDDFAGEKLNQYFGFFE